MLFHSYDEASKFVRNACAFIKRHYSYIDEFTGYLAFNDRFKSKIDECYAAIERHKSAIVNECQSYPALVDELPDWFLTDDVFKALAA